jgi:hypothetical protein
MAVQKADSCEQQRLGGEQQKLDRSSAVSSRLNRTANRIGWTTSRRCMKVSI